MLTGIATIGAWSLPNLDKMRQLGDPEADAAIAYWQKAKGTKESLQSLAHQLVGFQFAPEIDWLLEALASEDLDSATKLDPRHRVADCGFPSGDPVEKQKVLDQGQQVFQDHGLKILIVLVCYSLPAAYAAQKGVGVLHSNKGGTGYFVKDLNRRLLETTQFVMEVFADNGLAIDTAQPCGLQGPAIQSALRVRLLHAAVRGLIKANRDKSGGPTWDERLLGEPANQEDLAGTLMTFSCVVLDGLRKMRVELTPEQERGYLGIWMRIGRLLGVQIIPETLEQAEEVTKEIRRRQVDLPIREGVANPMGAEMTRNLLKFIRERLPWPVSSWPVPEALMLFFLPRTPADVPASLGIRRTRTRALLVAVIGMLFLVESRLTRFRIFHWLNRLMFVEWNQKDPRALSLLQFSRNVGRRLLRGVVASDRNRVLDVRQRPKFELHDWEHKWALDQTASPVKRARRAYARATGRPYEIRV